MTCSLSCGQTRNVDLPRAQSTVSQFIAQNCQNVERCEIPMGHVLDFPWDKMYFFDYRTENEDISRALGTVYVERTPEFSRKWIFVLGRKVVRVEEYPIVEIDRPLSDQDVDFEISDFEEGYGTFSREAIFEVEPINLENGRFFRLKCINCLRVKEK